jgi:hypothetical protein
MSRSSLPGFALAFGVLVASVAALLLAGGRGPQRGARPLLVRGQPRAQPVQLALPPPTPEPRG